MLAPACRTARRRRSGRGRRPVVPGYEHNVSKLSGFYEQYPVWYNNCGNHRPSKYLLPRRGTTDQAGTYTLLRSAGARLPARFPLSPMFSFFFFPLSREKEE